MTPVMMNLPNSYVFTMHCTSMAIYALFKEAQGCTVYGINPIAIKFSRITYIWMIPVNGHHRRPTLDICSHHISCNGFNAEQSVHLPVYRTYHTFLEEWQSWLCWICDISYWSYVGSILVLSDRTQFLFPPRSSSCSGAL
jgi:hypothetical protein